MELMNNSYNPLNSISLEDSFASEPNMEDDIMELRITIWNVSGLM